MIRSLDSSGAAQIAAVIVLICFVLAKVHLIRFRKHAVEVSGEVLKIFPHRQHTSYFIKYDYDGATRVAEYAGMPLVRELEIGEQVIILIDSTRPPDVPVPGKRHNATSQSGNCRLPGQPLISIWDLLVVGLCAYFVAKDHMPWLH